MGIIPDKIREKSLNATPTAVKGNGSSLWGGSFFGLNRSCASVRCLILIGFDGEVATQTGFGESELQGRLQAGTKDEKFVKIMKIIYLL